MKKASTLPQNVVSTRLSPGDRGLVVAVALLTRTSVSATVRELVREGAQARLRELARPTCTVDDHAPVAVQAVVRLPVQPHTRRSAR